MRRNKRQLRLLGLAILGLIGFIYLVFNFSPSAQITILSFNLSSIYFFFAFLFLFLISVFAFVFSSKRRGVFIGRVTFIYLILRLNHLTHPSFLILLIVLFGCLDLFFI